VGALIGLAHAFFSSKKGITPMNTRKIYRSEDGLHLFQFNFIDQGGHIDIYCSRHPSLNGQDASVVNTHLFENEQICFISGREPRTMRRALELAKQWAEYFLSYRQTGIVQQ
jgi:hypothetical protein